MYELVWYRMENVLTYEKNLSKEQRIKIDQPGLYIWIENLRTEAVPYDRAINYVGETTGSLINRTSEHLNSYRKAEYPIPEIYRTSSLFHTGKRYSKNSSLFPMKELKSNKLLFDTIVKEGEEYLKHLEIAFCPLDISDPILELEKNLIWDLWGLENSDSSGSKPKKIEYTMKGDLEFDYVKMVENSKKQLVAEKSRLHKRRRELL